MRFTLEGFDILPKILFREKIPEIKEVDLKVLSPTRRAECSQGYERLLTLPGFWRGRALVREEHLKELEANDSQEKCWLNLSSSARQLNLYEGLIQACESSQEKSSV